MVEVKERVNKWDNFRLKREEIMKRYIVAKQRSVNVQNSLKKILCLRFSKRYT